jgi:hypothetical protein
LEYWLFPTGRLNLGFITEGKLAAIFIKPSLGVSNWPVIYFINYTPTSFLAPFITAPSVLSTISLQLVNRSKIFQQMILHSLIKIILLNNEIIKLI